MAEASSAEHRFTDLGTMIAAQAAAFGDKPALRLGARETSYAAPEEIAGDFDAIAVQIYQVAQVVRFIIDALPRNGAGKVLRRSLRAPYRQGHRCPIA